MFEHVSETYPEMRIFLWGRSVGTVPTLALAAEFGKRVSGILLESGMASAGDAACRHGCRALSNKLDNLSQIRRVRNELPLLIVHGK